MHTLLFTFQSRVFHDQFFTTKFEYQESNCFNFQWLNIKYFYCKCFCHTFIIEIVYHHKSNHTNVPLCWIPVLLQYVNMVARFSHETYHINTSIGLKVSFPCIVHLYHPIYFTDLKQGFLFNKITLWMLQLKVLSKYMYTMINCTSLTTYIYSSD